MLQRVSDVAVILVAIVGIYAVATRNKQPAPVDQAPYKVGQTIDTLKAVEPRRSLLFAVSQTCPHCQKMMPVYRELIATARTKKDVVVAVTSVDTPEFRAFLAKHGVTPDAVLTTRETGLKIPNVPTTFVLEGRKLLAYSVGELASERVRAIRGAL